MLWGEAVNQWGGLFETSEMLVQSAQRQFHAAQISDVLAAGQLAVQLGAVHVELLGLSAKK